MNSLDTKGLLFIPGVLFLLSRFIVPVTAADAMFHDDSQNSCRYDNGGGP